MRSEEIEAKWTTALKILSQEKDLEQEGIIKILKKWKNFDMHIIRTKGAIADGKIKGIRPVAEGQQGTENDY